MHAEKDDHYGGGGGRPARAAKSGLPPWAARDPVLRTDLAVAHVTISALQMPDKPHSALTAGSQYRRSIVCGWPSQLSEEFRTFQFSMKLSPSQIPW